MQVALNTDFEVEVKFESLSSQRYQLQGLIVEQNGGNYLGFDFYSDGSTFRAFAASFTGRTPSVKANKAITGGLQLYMRVKRAGGRGIKSIGTRSFD